MARLVSGIAPAGRAASYGDCYWMLDQAAIATDIMFKTHRDRLDIWPDLVDHPAWLLGSEDLSSFRRVSARYR